MIVVGAVEICGYIHVLYPNLALRCDITKVSTSDACPARMLFYLRAGEHEASGKGFDYLIVERRATFS